MRSFDDLEFGRFLEWLLETGRITNSARGVAEKIIRDMTVMNLTVKEKSFLRHAILEPFAFGSCSRCCSELRWTEIPRAHENGRRCQKCEAKAEPDSGTIRAVL